MEKKDIEVKRWKEKHNGKEIEFTLKKRNKSLFELNDESRKAYKPTLIDYFDSARTPTEREMFNELIARENKIVDRMMGARRHQRAAEKKVIKLAKHAKRGKKVLSAAKQSGEARSAAYKKLYKEYRREAGYCKNGLTKEAIARFIANKVDQDIRHKLPINKCLEENDYLKPLKPKRIARII